MSNGKTNLGSINAMADFAIKRKGGRTDTCSPVPQGV